MIISLWSLIFCRFNISTTIIIPPQKIYALGNESPWLIFRKMSARGRQTWCTVTFSILCFLLKILAIFKHAYIMVSWTISPMMWSHQENNFCASQNQHCFWYSVIQHRCWCKLHQCEKNNSFKIHFPNWTKWVWLAGVYTFMGFKLLLNYCFKGL